MPHPWHNPHEAERQSRPWRWALQRTDTAAAGRGGQWAQAPVIRAGGRPRHPRLQLPGKRLPRGVWESSGLPSPGLLWEIGRGTRGGGRVWSAVPTEMQGREGVTDPLLLRRVSPSTALLMPSLMPSWGPSWAGPGHTSRPLLPGPLPHTHCPPASSAPAPRQESALTLSTSCSVLGPRDGVHGQGAKSHLPAHASPSGPSEESSPPSSGPPQPPKCPPAEPSTSPPLPQCKLSLSRQFSLSADLRVGSRGLSLSLSPYI